MSEKQPFIVHCGECNHEWAAFYSPMLVDKAVAITMSLHCPMCAASPMQIFCGPAKINTSAGCVNETEKS